MSAIHVKTFRDRVKDTQAFNNMNRILQSITCKRNNIVALEHGYKVASHMGYEKWKNQVNFNWSNKVIIKELIDNDKF